MSLRRAAIRAMGRSHRTVYRLTGGRLLGRVAGMPVLLLTTTGRRSGRARTTPLTYFEDGNELVIVASNGGEDEPPAWWLNLRAHPEATITIGSRSRSVTSRAATEDEHERLWPLITATHAGYASYARRTRRPIPVILLRWTEVRRTEVRRTKARRTKARRTKARRTKARRTKARRTKANAPNR